MSDRRRRLFRPSVPQEVDEEVEFHLAMRQRDLESDGLTPGDARDEAVRRFGDVSAVRAACRRIGQERDRGRRRTELLAEAGRDVVYAVRQLVRAPGFALVAVLTLAIGVGATTAIFSLVDAVLLRPMPFPGAERLVVPAARGAEHDDTWNVTWADYLAWREAGVFESVALHGWVEVNVGGGIEPEQVSGVRVTEDFFATLGAAPTLGRYFTVDEFVPGTPLRLVVSYGFWQRHFGGARDVLGRSIRLAGRPAEIVGVVPRGQSYPRGVDVWVPLRPPPANPNEEWDNFIYGGIARLAPGRSLAATRAELHRLAERPRVEHPQMRADVTITALPLIDHVVGDEVTRALWVFLAAVGIVLLIGCVNIANLLLGRFATRTRELSIRGALGAGRARLLRQLLTESLVLGAAGGALGVLLAYAGVRALLAIAPPDLPRLDGVGVDATVLGFGLAVSLVSVVVFGLAPALRSSRLAGAAPDEPDLRVTTGTRGRRARDLLVVAELALSLVLLVGAGLLLRSLLHLRDTHPGLEVEQRLTFSVSLQDERYQGRVADAFEELRGRIAGVGAVERVALASSLPLGGGGFYLGRAFLTEGRPEPPAGEEVHGQWNVVTPGWFGTAGVPLLAGRDFTAADRADARPVAIVGRAFARAMFGDENPIGRRVRSWRDENVYRTIVGVVGDVRFFGAADEIRPVFYVPHAQTPWSSMVVVAQTAGDPLAAVSSVRAAVRDFDDQLALADVQSMRDALDTSIATRRFGALLLAAFATAALALAIIGTYGVLAYTVAQRTREIGIRMALGARSRDVLRLVLSEAAAMVAAGLVLGLAGALALSRVMRSLLFEISATDPLTYAAVAGILAAIGLIAGFIPARRAAALDPMRTIRG